MHNYIRVPYVCSRKSSSLNTSKGSLDRPNEKEGVNAWMGNKQFSKIVRVRAAVKLQSEVAVETR